ncbi:MAG: sulfite exporter TauE/SafE family protein, partial [Fimbriimonadaceae bacterium]|nr:sulfite exporter TauE/SafE family protein [Fimbriimonadaceae bacterium]
MFVLGAALFILVGLTMGLIGAGGSILLLPILVFLFGFDATQGTAASLILVGVTALAGAGIRHRESLVDWRAVGLLTPAGIVGVFAVRMWVVPALPPELGRLGSWIFTRDDLILGTFAVVMTLAAVSMLRQGAAPEADSATAEPKPVQVTALGLGVGALAGFVGAGGGFLWIPALVKGMNMEMKRAVGTSLAIIALNSLIGVLGDFSRFGSLPWWLVGTAACLTLVGLVIGQALSRRLPGASLQPAF